MNITDYRKQIDDIDHQLIDLLDKRFQIVKKIGTIKHIQEQEAFDHKRWDQVSADRGSYAKKRGVSMELIQKIWNLIHKHSLELEQGNE